MIQHTSDLFSFLDTFVLEKVSTTSDSCWEVIYFVFPTRTFSIHIKATNTPVTPYDTAPGRQTPVVLSRRLLVKGGSATLQCFSSIPSLFLRPMRDHDEEKSIGKVKGLSRSLGGNKNTSQNASRKASHAFLLPPHRFFVLVGARNSRRRKTDIFPPSECWLEGLSFRAHDRLAQGIIHNIPSFFFLSEINFPTLFNLPHPTKVQYPCT